MPLVNGNQSTVLVKVVLSTLNSSPMTDPGLELTPLLTTAPTPLQRRRTAAKARHLAPPPLPVLPLLATPKAMDFAAASARVLTLRSRPFFVKVQRSIFAATRKTAGNQSSAATPMDTSALSTSTMTAAA